MPFSLDYWPKYTAKQTARIDSTYNLMRGTVSPNLQFLLGEILVIRAAQILEEALPAVFYRLVCQASFIDGTAPLNIASADSLSNAEKLIRTHGRGAKPLFGFLKWLQSNDVRKNLEHVLAKNDHSLRTIDNYSVELNELRIVRNEAAHHVKSTRALYRNIVVLRYYGSTKYFIPVGKFVVSGRTASPVPLLRYTTTVRALIKDICKA